EVIKKSGGKVQAETEGNILVFTNVEPEDVIFIKYKIQSYYYGKIAKNFTAAFGFDSYIPIEYSRYGLLVADKYKFEHKMFNADLTPTIKKVEDFNLYVWEKRKMAELKSEPFMPELCDIAPTLHISSIPSWQVISDWYSDLAYSKTEEDYEIRAVYETLFEGKKGLNDLAKAQIIYNYIQKNIRYSSIPFRQGSYVPQKAAKTIATQLGDCKDVSSLFVALGKLAGLKTRLVLVNTRDNGLNDLVLPSVGFNHCIAKLTTEGKDYYLELTDNVLPFGSLPPSLYNAAILEIPYPDEKVTAQLQHLKSDTRTLNETNFTMNISLDKNDLKIKANCLKVGALTSSFRYNLAEKSEEKQKEYVQKRLAENVKNVVSIQNIKFDNNLNSLGDSISYEVDYTIKNEVIDVGEMSMFRLPIIDVVATLEAFPQETRNFAVEYWEYENIDLYNGSYIISVPAGKTFTDLPADLSLNANGNTYTLKYEKLADNQLKITRKIQTNRNNISPENYPAFKEFIEKLTKAETKYIAFK
ncbi:MAG: transglutaminase domain-containing protein, partial [Bacteroidia bacterium]